MLSKDFLFANYIKKDSQFTFFINRMENSVVEVGPIISRFNAPEITIPLYNSVHAGFPSPIGDLSEEEIDLNSYLIKNSATSFLVGAVSESISEAGINEGDLLLVERNLKPQDGKIVIAVIFGFMLIKKLKIEEQRMFLISDNDNKPHLEVSESSGVHVWGTVTNVIHPVEKIAAV